MVQQTSRSFTLHHNSIMAYFILFLLYFSELIVFISGFAVNIKNRTERDDMSYGSPAYKYCECGKKNVLVGDIRIVGGIETVETEYPWMALITGNGTKLSGGTLINDRYVVTSAHILDRGYPEKWLRRKTVRFLEDFLSFNQASPVRAAISEFRMNEMKVVLGEYNVCESDDQIIVFSIAKLIIHPKYNGATLFADIMLVKLNMRVTFNEFIRPICLPSTDIKTRTMRKYGTKNATVLGWGYADIGRDVCILRMVDLQVFKPENCDSNIQTIICAGMMDGSAHDACSGDSGGPLQVLNSRGRFELIGIVSSGIGCGTGTPGLYTDVPQMVAWIMKITTIDSMYCWR